MPIVIVPYDPNWKKQFQQLSDEIAVAVGDLAVSIEHVGSTSVEGLDAKPIIDLTIVVEEAADFGAGISRLATIGYEHCGDLGVTGREAFSNPPHSIAHHLYICAQGSPALRNHLAFRDHLREHHDVAREYGQLKRQLAAEFRDDIEGYVDGKTDFILTILKQSELSENELASIEDSNRKTN